MGTNFLWNKSEINTGTVRGGITTVSKLVTENKLNWSQVCLYIVFVDDAKAAFIIFSMLPKSCSGEAYLVFCMDIVTCTGC